MKAVNLFSIIVLSALAVACGASENPIDILTHQRPIADGFYTLPIPMKFGASVTSDEREVVMRAGETWAAAFGGRQAFSFDVSIPPCDETDTCAAAGLLRPVDDFNGDHSNTIEMATNWTRVIEPAIHNTIGITYLIFGKKKKRAAGIEADIVFNREGFNLVDILDTSNEILISGPKLTVDFESLALHELGHALGLGHNPDNFSSPMYPSLCPYTREARRELTSDDFEAVARLYRVGKKPEAAAE